MPDTLTKRQIQIIQFLVGQKGWVSPACIGHELWGGHGAQGFPICNELVDQGYLDCNSQGYYRAKPGLSLWKNRPWEVSMEVGNDRSYDDGLVSRYTSDVKWVYIEKEGMPPKDVRTIKLGNQCLDRRFLIKGEYSLNVAYMSGSAFDLPEDETDIPVAWAIIEGF